MVESIFVFVMVFTGAVSLWGMASKPVPREKTKPKYQGIKNLPAWHKNVGTRWNG